MLARVWKSWWMAGILLLAFGAAAAWRLDSRATARKDAETAKRINDDVNKSIGSAMGGIKLCPLSQPDCNSGQK